MKTWLKYVFIIQSVEVNDAPMPGLWANECLPVNWLAPEVLSCGVWCVILVNVYEVWSNVPCLSCQNAKLNIAEYFEYKIIRLKLHHTGKYNDTYLQHAAVHQHFICYRNLKKNLKLVWKWQWRLRTTREIFHCTCVFDYRQVSFIRRILAGNKIVDHSDVVGASPVGAAPTTSSFST